MALLWTAVLMLRAGESPRPCAFNGETFLEVVEAVGDLEPPSPYPNDFGGAFLAVAAVTTLLLLPIDPILARDDGLFTTDLPVPVVL